MVKKELSPREEEIVQLCVDGLTNDAIAHRLQISVGTVNTYWLRIKLKVGGLGKTDTVVRVVKERAEKALRDSNIERASLVEMVAEKEKSLLDLRSALALLHLAMDQIKSTVWATDADLVIYSLANGEFPSIHFGVCWEVGKTVYEIFKTKDGDNPAIAAHLSALKGHETGVNLTGEFAGMFLRVLPLTEDNGEIIGTVAIINTVNQGDSHRAYSALELDGASSAVGT
jgi:DNA-binding CsgD family transcriptional regulator